MENPAELARVAVQDVRAVICNPTLFNWALPRATGVLRVLLLLGHISEEEFKAYHQELRELVDMQGKQNANKG